MEWAISYNALCLALIAAYVLYDLSGKHHSEYRRDMAETTVDSCLILASVRSETLVFKKFIGIDTGEFS